MNRTVVISLGGSIVAPDAPDSAFLAGFYRLVEGLLRAEPGARVILVTGGGAPARAYQAAYRSVLGALGTAASNEEQDWIGIMATRLNGRLVKALFAGFCADELVTDPTADFQFRGRVLVASGWKPGFSTDFDAVLLALRFEADTVVNLSNVARVYSADPSKDPSAVPYDRMTWKEFRVLVGDEWVPGKNVPFDPIAAKKASEAKLSVVMAAGRDLDNLKAILESKPFTGTTIGPD